MSGNWPGRLTAEPPSTSVIRSGKASRISYGAESALTRYSPAPDVPEIACSPSRIYHDDGLREHRSRRERVPALLRLPAHITGVGWPMQVRARSPRAGRQPGYVVVTHWRSAWRGLPARPVPRQAGGAG